MSGSMIGAAAALSMASAAIGATVTFGGGNLTGTAETNVQAPGGGGFDADGAGFTTLNSTMASGGTDSGIVTGSTVVSGQASLSVQANSARSGGPASVVFEAFAEARIDNVGDAFAVSQSIAIGPGGVPGNFLIINVDQETDFTFDVEILNANENSSSSVMFSEGASGTLFAGQDYFLFWSIGAFASLNTASLIDDVEIRATLLLPGPGAAGVLLGVAGFAGCSRRRRGA